MARGRIHDLNSEDEEAEFEEEEDPQQSRSIAIPRRTSEEGSNMEKDLAKPLPSPRKLQSVPRRKAPPIQIPLPADGKDAQNRLSSVKKNVPKPKSNAAQLPNQARANASSSTSKFLQSTNKATANLKNAPRPMVAPDPNQAVANLQRVPKPTNNVAQRPQRSVAVAAKPKTTVTKRKPVKDLGITQRKKAKQDESFAEIFKKIYNQSKKAKPDEMFANVYESLYNKDDLESDEDDAEPITIDRMIAKAERMLLRTPADHGEQETINDRDREEIVQVVRYSATIAKAHKKSVEAGKEPSSQSPIWSTEKGALQMLHGLQAMNIIVCDILASIAFHERVCDILASIAFYKKSDDDQIMQMLSIYITYQLDQNSGNQVNFDQDLEVMEKLIEKFVSNGSLCKVFAEAFPIDNHPLLGGWVELEGVESSKKRGKKELDNLVESDVADRKHGARLLLLLAYMMVSNVLDDESNNTQIRPAIRILGSKPEWKPVLRKLGQMLFIISPDPSIAEYDECYKICINQFHFLNSYLFINKAGGKKTPAQKGSPTSPKIQTSHALQRFSVMIMSGFLLNRFQQLPDDHVHAELGVCKTIKSLIATILRSKNITDTLHALGYDIALRNWIKDSTGSLRLHEKKPRGKRDGKQLQAQLLQMEKNMRNIQSKFFEMEKQMRNIQKETDRLREQLRDAQKQIQDLQRHQYGQNALQTWFSMNKCLLENLLHGSEGKNSDNDNFAQDENGKERDEFSENDDDEIEDIDDADGQENEHNVGEIQENVEDGEEEAEEEEELVMKESDSEQEVEEFDNPFQ